MSSCMAACGSTEISLARRLDRQYSEYDDLHGSNVGFLPVLRRIAAILCTETWESASAILHMKEMSLLQLAKRRT